MLRIFTVKASGCGCGMKPASKGGRITLKTNKQKASKARAKNKTTRKGSIKGKSRASSKKK